MSYRKLLNDSAYNVISAKLPLLRKSPEPEDDPCLDDLVSHDGNYSGGFILFGG